jgi:hypothetical protein
MRCPEGVTTDWIDSGHWEVWVAGHRVPALPSLRPFYDPERRRILG